MAVYHAYFHPTGSFSVKIEIPDDEVPEFEEDLVDRIMDEAYEAVPNSVCAQCSGWGQEWSLDFGDADVQYIDKDDGTVVYDSKF